jgi:hypothetical protein
MNTRFVTECNKACVHTPLSIHTNSDNSACSLPTVPGMCRGYFPRFSYHSDTNKCTQFIFGGCGGNQNNFLTENECYVILSIAHYFGKFTTSGYPFSIFKLISISQI